MTALLGLLAVAGYQNRDKIAELVSGLGTHAPQVPGQGANASQNAPRSTAEARQMCSVAEAGRWVGLGLRPD